MGRWHIPTILFLLALLLGACEDTRPSNNAITPIEAQIRLDDQIRKTYEVSDDLRRVEDALRPIEIFFSDIARLIQNSLGGHVRAADGSRRVIDHIRTILKQATETLVDIQPDGSWKVERRMPPHIFGTDDETGADLCPEPTLEVFGSPHDGGDEITVSVRCTGRLEETVASVFVQHPGRVDVHLFPEAIDRLSGRDLQNADKAPECVMRVFEDTASLHCDSFGFREKEGFELRIDELEYESVDDGLDFLSIDDHTDLVLKASAAMSIAGIRSHRAGFRFEKHPGSRIQYSPFLPAAEKEETR